MRWLPRVTCAGVGILGAAFACGPIEATSVLRGPVNACPLHDCAAYAQDGGAPSCNAGACTVSAAANDLVLVLALPTDAFVAPGRTYLINLSSAPNQPGVPASCDSDGGAPKDDGGPCDPPLCTPPCCPLPLYAQDRTNYLVDPKDSQSVGWYLGNPPGLLVDTTLPIEATYRRMWGTTQRDALSLGLPVAPVSGHLLPNAGGAPGPGGTPALEVDAYLQPGCYERTLQPYAPFDRAFPPDIQTVSLAAGSPPNLDNLIDGFDATKYQNQTGALNGQFPTFQITRANGLNGWTARLRDQTTKQLASNIAALSGSFAKVTLVTHHPSSTKVDALANLQLVVAPPAGTPMPSYVTARVAEDFPEGQPYPTLPTPVTMTGRIFTLPGVPVEADLIFTATDITGPSGTPEPSSSFEFVARAHAIVDPKTDMSTYSVLLPRGDYRDRSRPEGCFERADRGHAPRGRTGRQADRGGHRRGRPEHRARTGARGRRAAPRGGDRRGGAEGVPDRLAVPGGLRSGCPVRAPTGGGDDRRRRFVHPRCRSGRLPAARSARPKVRVCRGSRDPSSSARLR